MKLYLLLAMFFMVIGNRPMFMAALLHNDTIQNIQSSVNCSNTSDDIITNEKAGPKKKINKTKNSFTDSVIFKSSTVTIVQILFSALIPYIIQDALLILFVFEVPIVFVVLLLGFIMILLVKKI